MTSVFALLSFWVVFLFSFFNWWMTWCMEWKKKDYLEIWIRHSCSCKIILPITKLCMSSSTLPLCMLKMFWIELLHQLLCQFHVTKLKVFLRSQKEDILSGAVFGNTTRSSWRKVCVSANFSKLSALYVLTCSWYSKWDLRLRVKNAVWLITHKWYWCYCGGLGVGVC